jgi:hypothetical protein
MVLKQTSDAVYAAAGLSAALLLLLLLLFAKLEWTGALIARLTLTSCC